PTFRRGSASPGSASPPAAARAGHAAGRPHWPEPTLRRYLGAGAHRAGRRPCRYTATLAPRCHLLSVADHSSLIRLLFQPTQEPLPMDADLVPPAARDEKRRDLPRPRQLPDALIPEAREFGGLPDGDQYGLAAHQAADLPRAPWRLRIFSWC